MMNLFMLNVILKCSQRKVMFNNEESLLLQSEGDSETYLEMCVCFSQEDQDRTIGW